MDLYTRQRRSEIMSSITAKNTLPEVRVRKVLHGLGYRFRLHRADLPGRPDIVLPKFKIAIFVHGCFWHGHTCCDGHRPKTNVRYWNPKLDGNLKRDKQNASKLRRLGWRRIVIWECETARMQKLEDRLDKSIQRLLA